jgi:elongation factor P
MTANEIRPKNVIRIEDKIFRVIKIEHVKPGKGPAYVVLTLKNFTTDSQQKIRLRTSEKVETVDVISKETVHTYSKSGIFFFLDDEGEEISVVEDQIPHKKLIEAGMQYKILYAGDEIISVSLPDEIEVEVAFAPPFITGQSATAQTKKIRTTNDLEIEVPQYIKKGDILKLNNELEFIKRA